MRRRTCGQRWMCMVRFPCAEIACLSLLLRLMFSFVVVCCCCRCRCSSDSVARAEKEADLAATRSLHLDLKAQQRSLKLLRAKSEL